MLPPDLSFPPVTIPASCNKVSLVEQREYFRAGCGVWTGKATVGLRMKEEMRVMEIEYRQEYNALCT
jgi:hypothetical protein